MTNKLKKIINILEVIYNYNILSHFKTLAPTEMQINITYRCNSHCQMCQIWKMKPSNELSFIEWQQIMKDPIFSSIRRLTIAGGEPILHPELIKLSQLFIDSMPNLRQLDLVTNGFLSQKTIVIIKQLAVLCRKKNIQLNINVSLDGIAQMHETMRGVPDAYKKTTKTILALKSIQKKYHFWLGIGGVICHLNLYEIEKVEEWCKKNTLPFNYQIIGFHNNYVQNINKKIALDFKEKDRKYLFTLLQKLASRSSLKDIRSCLRAYYWQDMLNMYKDGTNRQTPCSFANDAFVLDSFGDVYYCLSENKIGNCRNGKSISNIYYNDHNLELRKRRQSTVCLKCNSGCFVGLAIVKDFRKFARFYLKSLLRGFQNHFKA